MCVSNYIHQFVYGYDIDQAVGELEGCYESGPGKEDSQVRMKLQEAKRLLKKSKRVNLYEILGCPRGEMSSEQEIGKAYKKMALKWHPDRHSSKVIIIILSSFYFVFSFGSISMLLL